MSLSRTRGESGLGDGQELALPPPRLAPRRRLHRGPPATRACTSSVDGRPISAPCATVYACRPSGEQAVLGEEHAQRDRRRARRRVLDAPAGRTYAGARSGVGSTATTARPVCPRSPRDRGRVAPRGRPSPLHRQEREGIPAPATPAAAWRRRRRGPARPRPPAPSVQVRPHLRVPPVTRAPVVSTRTGSSPAPHSCTRRRSRIMSVARQRPGRTDARVPGERQLPGRREDPQLVRWRARWSPAW